MAERTYWATILTIIDAGLQGEKEKVWAHAELLAKNLHADGEQDLAARIVRVMAGESKKNTFGFEPWAGQKPAEEENNA